MPDILVYRKNEGSATPFDYKTVAKTEVVTPASSWTPCSEITFSPYSNRVTIDSITETKSENIIKVHIVATTVVALSSSNNTLFTKSPITLAGTGVASLNGSGSYQVGTSANTQNVDIAHGQTVAIGSVFVVDIIFVTQG